MRCLAGTGRSSSGRAEGERRFVRELRRANGQSVCVWPVFTKEVGKEGQFLVLTGSLTVMDDYVIVDSLRLPFGCIGMFEILPSDEAKAEKVEMPEEKRRIGAGMRPGHYL